MRFAALLLTMALLIVCFQNCGGDFVPGPMVAKPTANLDSRGPASDSFPSNSGSDLPTASLPAGPTPVPTAQPPSTPNPNATAMPTPAPTSTPGPLMPATPPANPPTPMTGTSLVTTISTNHGSTTVLSHEISAGAGFVAKGQDSQKWLERNQPGAFAEFDVNIVEAGVCGLALLYWEAAAGVELDLYVDGTLISKAVSAKNANEEARVPNAFRQFTLGRHKIKLVTGAQSGALQLRGIQMNCPGDPLANLGRVQALSASGTTTLQLDSAIDFYRLGLKPIQGEKYWACVWTFCFFEFLVSSEKAASFELTMKYIQQSNENHACVGHSVNGIQQATLDMNGGTGRTTPKTLVLPAGTSRLRIPNTNYFNDVFCFGGSYSDIRLRPVSL